MAYGYNDTYKVDFDSSKLTCPLLHLFIFSILAHVPRRVMVVRLENHENLYYLVQCLQSIMLETEGGFAARGKRPTDLYMGGNRGKVLGRRGINV